MRRGVVKSLKYVSQQVKSLLELVLLLYGTSLPPQCTEKCRDK
jgi:hypothetical protein